MPTARNRLQRRSQGFSPIIEFYREEFVKHHECLQEQREYYSEQAIASVETVLVRVIAEADKLSKNADAEAMVARLLREFDVVTGLSNWSDPLKVH
jgi:hypothetical protein